MPTPYQSQAIHCTERAIEHADHAWMLAAEASHYAESHSFSKAMLEASNACIHANSILQEALNILRSAEPG